MIVDKLKSNKTLIIIIIIIDAIVPLFIWPYGQDYFYFPKLIIIYFTISLSILFCAFFYRYLDFTISKEFIPLLLFMGLAVLSASFSQYKTQALFGKVLRYEGAFTLILYFLIFYFSFISIKYVENIGAIVFSILVSASIISVYALLQYFGIDIIPRDFIRKDWIFFSFATLGNPNFLGSYLSMIFPIIICLYTTCEKKKMKYLLFILTLLFYSALVCSRTRSAWLGTGITLLILFIVFFNKVIKSKERIIVLVAVCIVLTYILDGIHGGMISERVVLFIEDFKKLTGFSEDVLSAGSQRIFIWSKALGHVLDRPILGYGPDTFDAVFVMTSEEAVRRFSLELYVDKAHNEYLQILVTMGFPALISYLSFIFVVIYKSLKAISSHNSNIYSVCLLSAVFSYLIQAFFNISVVSVAPVYWSIIGLLTASYQKNKNRKPGL